MFISPMNTKSGIITHGFGTHENTAFGVHSVKLKTDITLKKSNNLYALKLNYTIVMMII